MHFYYLRKHTCEQFQRKWANWKNYIISSDLRHSPFAPYFRPGWSSPFTEGKTGRPVQKLHSLLSFSIKYFLLIIFNSTLFVLPLSRCLTELEVKTGTLYQRFQIRAEIYNIFPSVKTSSYYILRFLVLMNCRKWNISFEIWRAQFRKLKLKHFNPFTCECRCSKSLMMCKTTTTLSIWTKILEGIKCLSYNHNTIQ